MKKILTTSLASLLVLGGCVFGGDESSSTPDSQLEDETQHEEEDQDQDQNQSNSEEDETSDENKDESESSMSDDGNDSTTNESDESTNESDETENTEEKSNESNQNSDEENSNTEAKHPMDKGRAEAELEEYEQAFKKVINHKTDDGELKEYKTKDKLKEHFMHFMSEKRADQWISTYFVMKDGTLHVKAMGGPRFLNSDEPFELKQGSNGTYKVVQEIDNELKGHIKTTFTLTVNDGGYWIIQDVTSERLE